MPTAIRTRLASCALLYSLAMPVMAQGDDASSRPANRLDEGLGRAQGYIAVFVRMRDQLFAQGGDYERFCAGQPQGTRRLELRSRIRNTLTAKAEQSFEAVRRELDGLTEGENVRGIQRYWIVNGFACEATAAGCSALAGLPGVGFVYRQRYGAQHRPHAGRPTAPDPKLTKLFQQLLAERSEGPEQPFDAAAVSTPWNLKTVRATDAWTDHGVTGQGVVVAVLDDGMMTVPALLPALWHNPGEQLNGKDDDGNGYVDDVFGYDFAANTPYCVTPSGHRHGTLCAGIVAARPTLGEEPFATSVAPRASIMPLVGSGRLLAYQYAVDHGADVLSMSYTFEPDTMGHYRGLYRTAHEHLSAAGIVAVGGAGNYARRRPQGKQIGSPKDIPCVIAAAGVGPDLTASSFSSRGPVSWQGIRYFDQDLSNHDRASKPDVTSCNAGFPVWTRRSVWTGARAKRLEKIVHEDGRGYVLAIGPRGNSFAGPHAAGVAALMLEANPDLPTWHLQRLMESTCRDMGKPGRDHTHGAGMLQADKAVAAARAFRFE